MFEKVIIKNIKVNKNNPRTITKDKMDKLINSLLVFPKMLEIRPLVVDEKGELLAGNMRLQALRKISQMKQADIQKRLEGIADYATKTDAEKNEIVEYWRKWLNNKKVSVLHADKLSEKEKLQFIIKDNVSFGEWDVDNLSAEWDIELLDDWGVDTSAWYLESDNFDGTEQVVTEDEFDEEKEDITPVTRKGDVFLLGEHRLMCGDSTSEDDVAKLMNGERAELTLTDPPYGIEVVSKGGTIGGGNVCATGIYSPVIGDETTETAEKAYQRMTDVSDKQIIFGGNYFTQFLPFSDSWIIWDKRNDSGIRNNFADGEMAWCSFHTPVRIYHQLWAGMIKEGEHDKRVHPTQKPVKMLGEILADFSKEGQDVLDLFGGSGSTLIACEQLGRKCYMMELDPHYCDVIIARWEKFTGNKAIKL